MYPLVPLLLTHWNSMLNCIALPLLQVFYKREGKSQAGKGFFLRNKFLFLLQKLCPVLWPLSLCYDVIILLCLLQQYEITKTDTHAIWFTGKRTNRKTPNLAFVSRSSMPKWPFSLEIIFKVKLSIQISRNLCFRIRFFIEYQVIRIKKIFSHLTLPCSKIFELFTFIKPDYTQSYITRYFNLSTTIMLNI